jgi:hypothetical protein
VPERFQTFKDLNTSFAVHPITGDLSVLKDDNAIKQAVINLLLTDKGERLFEPQIGSNIRRLLFDILDFGTAALVQNEIKQCLRDYEPRIRVDNVIATPNFDENGFDVTLAFTIIGRDDDPVAVEFFLERTR